MRSMMVRPSKLFFEHKYYFLISYNRMKTMRILKWSAGCWCFCFLILGGTQAEETKTIGIPFISNLIAKDEKGQLYGPTIDYWEKNICPTMEIDCQYQSITFGRMVQNIKVGEIDVLLFVNKNSEREVFAYYPSVPSWKSLFPMVSLKSNPINHITQSSDLYGLSIGYAINMHLPELLRDPKLKFEKIGGVDWDKQNLIKLRRQWIDLAYYPSIDAMKGALRKIDFDDELKIIYLPQPALYYSIFSKKVKNAEAFYQTYEERIIKTGIEEGIQQYVEDHSLTK